MAILENSCKSIDECLCCGNKNLVNVLDLNEQPLANSYLKSASEDENVYPLGLNYCTECTHLQLTHAVNPDLLFRDYLYVSGTTDTLRKYFEVFVSFTADYFGPISKSSGKMSVLDIACNDGSQLDAYKKYGYETYGIDPAVNLYPISSKNHNIVCDYLTDESIAKFKTKFDIIIAQNVFAHNTYPKEFLEICKNNLSKDGFIFIQTSQADMVKYGQFDTVYHEHISFFSIKSMASLVNRAGLYLHDVQKTDIHGTSYVFVLTADKSKDKTLEMIASEVAHTLDTVNKFSNNAKATVIKLEKTLEKYRADGYAIVGYGAAAKGNTVLNFGKIKLDYIVDDNPLKQSLYSPGTKIPIVSFDYIHNLNKEDDVVWVPLSWNFFKEIKERIESKRTTNKDIFVQLDFTQL